MGVHPWLIVLTAIVTLPVLLATYNNGDAGNTLPTGEPVPTEAARIPAPMFG